MKHITIVFSFLLLALTATAQPGKVKDTWQQSYEKGEEMMTYNSYYSAAEHYKAALDVIKDDVGLTYKLAEAYRLGRNYKRAASSYKRIAKKLMRMKSDEKSQYDFRLLQYHLGQTLLQSENYDDAEVAFQTFIDEFDTELDPSYKAMAEVGMQSVAYFRAQNPSLVSPLELDRLSKKVNSKYTESAPVPWGATELIFSSMDENEAVEMLEKDAPSRIFMATVEELNRPKTPVEYDLGIRFDSDQHVSNLCFSSDKQTIYFTVCQENETMECTIYKATKSAENWENAQAISGAINQEGTSSTTPFIYKKNGRDYMIFASNRAGGQGGYDLYESPTNDFSVVSNIASVNSIGDETTPFVDMAEEYVDARARLYFSTDGRPGLGGHDVFVSYFENGNFSTPKNVGKFLNTAQDDMYFVMDQSKERGYVVSNRIGGYSIDSRTCCDDIFYMTLRKPKRVGDVDLIVSGNVKDGDGNAIDDVLISITEKGKPDVVIDQVQTISGKGYQIDGLELDKEYVITYIKDGYVQGTESISTKGLKQDKTFAKDIVLDQNVVIVTGDAVSDKGRDGRVPLAGATVDVYVVNPSTGEETVYTKVTSANDGKFKIELPNGKKYKFVATADEHLKISSSADFSGKSGKIDHSLNVTLLSKEKDVTFQVDNIYYDFDKSTLRDESVAALEKLKGFLLENPTIIVEIGAHTDNKGNPNYNKSLSRRRAEKVVNWLIKNGIDTNRLSSKGYGESQPIAPNENEDGSDNPDGRQLNRRTEFKIIGEI